MEHLMKSDFDSLLHDFHEVFIEIKMFLVRIYYKLLFFLKFRLFNNIMTEPNPQWSDEVINIPTGYAPAITSLGIVTDNKVEWLSCRETFHNKSTEIDSFIFCCGKDHTNRVLEFINTVEQICKVPEENRIKIRKTNMSGVIYVGMSDWWKYRVRRSLLTALLRCGINFHDNSANGFEFALWSMNYTLNTRLAINRFLGGYTSCKLKKDTIFNGWVSFFFNMPAAKIEKILVKPKKKKKEASNDLHEKG